MPIQNFTSGILQNNNYLVWDEETLEAVLIDCSAPNQDIIDFIHEKELHLKFILLTHGHFDHIMGVDFFQEKLKVKAYLNKEDKPLVDNFNTALDRFHLPKMPAPKINHFFGKNTPFFLGKEKIKIFTTPGHTKGGTCFFIQNCLFSGDTLFYGSYGRTDFSESNPQEMQKSLKFLFQQFPDTTLVYPGHGPATTIEKERPLYE